MNKEIQHFENEMSNSSSKDFGNVSALVSAITRVVNTVKKPAVLIITLSFLVLALLTLTLQFSEVLQTAGDAVYVSVVCPSRPCLCSGY